MSVRSEEHPPFLWVSGGTDRICLYVCVRLCCCVDSSAIACSWITFLPVCLISFPSSAGLDFLLWELGLFEEAYWARSLEGCQDQPWPANTSKGSKLTAAKHFLNHWTDSLGFTLPRRRGTNSLMLSVGSLSCAEERSCSHAREDECKNTCEHSAACKRGQKKKKCRGYEYIYVRKESTHPRQKTQKQEGTSHKGCRDGLTHIISLQ